MCVWGETTEADSVHADISSFSSFTSGKKHSEGKMFQAQQTNDLLNASCLVDVIVQVFRRKFAALPYLSADTS